MRKLRNDEAAVSPVIGVILMVAITVVLAAVIFVLVQNLSGDSGEAAPKAAFEKEGAGTGGTIQVIQAPAGLDVGQLEASDGCVLKGADAQNKTAGDLEAGDYWLCDSDGPAHIVHTESNTLIYQTEL